MRSVQSVYDMIAVEMSRGTGDLGARG